MANAKFNLQSELGGVTTVTTSDTANNGTVVIPESGNLASVNTAVTDNSIVRYDGTTGKLQNSGVIIDDNGNVGIGVTPNSITPWYYTLQMNGSAGLALMSSSNDTHLSTNSYYNSGYRYQTSGVAASDYSQSSGAHYWRTAPVGTAGNTVNWINAMHLDSSTYPSLSVKGSIRSGYDGNSHAPDRSTGIFSTAGNGSNYIAMIGSANAAGSNIVLESISAGSRRAAILDNGNFQSATNVYGSTSDIKLKENVVDTTPKLEKLMQVQVRNFNYIGQDDKQIGVVAQEIEKIFPSIVFETKDTKQVEVTKTRDITDVDGNVIKEEYTEFETQETGEVTKNVKYSVIYMMMLKAMQEQQEIINDLKVRVEKLELGGN